MPSQVVDARAAFRDPVIGTQVVQRVELQVVALEKPAVKGEGDGNEDEESRNKVSRDQPSIEAFEARLEVPTPTGLSFVGCAFLSLPFESFLPYLQHWQTFDGMSRYARHFSADPTLLQNYSSRYKHDYWQVNETYRLITNAPPGPATDDYETLRAEAGPLGTTPAVISTQYFCTVPQRKSGGNLFVSILVADIVFQQVIWKPFNLIVGWTALRRVPQAEFCEGCGHQQSTTLIDSPGYRRLAESSEPLAADTTGVELNTMKPVFRTTETAPRRSMGAHSLDQEGLLR